MANLQYPAIKMIHHAASRRLKLPLAPMKLALYLAFLGKGRDTVGAVAMVKNVRQRSAPSTATLRTRTIQQRSTLPSRR